jgi:hypothetical protein
MKKAKLKLKQGQVAVKGKLTEQEKDALQLRFLEFDEKFNDSLVAKSEFYVQTIEKHPEMIKEFKNANPGIHAEWWHYFYMIGNDMMDSRLPTALTHAARRILGQLPKKVQTHFLDTPSVLMIDKFEDHDSDAKMNAIINMDAERLKMAFDINRGCVRDLDGQRAYLREYRPEKKRKKDAAKSWKVVMENGCKIVYFVKAGSAPLSDINAEAMLLD